MIRKENNPTIILVPGHWLGAWAWDKVVEHLRQTGCTTVAMTLPGLDPQDPERSTRTLDEQAAAIEEALRQVSGPPPILVAHSGANAPVSMVLDRYPELVGHIVWVDTGPFPSGSAFAPDTSAELVELPLPDFKTLAQQGSLDGLDSEDLIRFRNLAVPEPGPILRQAVYLTNAQRLAVPTTLVCCSIPSTQIMEFALAGHPMFAEAAKLENLKMVDLPTGHWPMWSRPEELARIISTLLSCRLNLL